MDKELTWIEEGLSDLLAKGDYSGESADARAARYVRQVLYHRGGVRIGNAADALIMAALEYARQKGEQDNG